MKKNQIIVETPYGTVTRTSARPYQFVIVSKGVSVAYELARHEASVAYNTKLAARYLVTAAAGGTNPFPGYHQTPEEFTQWAADASAAAARPFQPSDPEQVTVQGWSQSAAGAGKFVAEAQRYGHLNVVVVPIPA